MASVGHWYPGTLKRFLLPDPCGAGRSSAVVREILLLIFGIDATMLLFTIAHPFRVHSVTACLLKRFDRARGRQPRALSFLHHISPLPLVCGAVRVSPGIAGNRRLAVAAGGNEGLDLAHVEPDVPVDVNGAWNLAGFRPPLDSRNAVAERHAHVVEIGRANV